MYELVILNNKMISNEIKPTKIFQEIALDMNENRNELNKLIQLIIEN